MLALHSFLWDECGNAAANGKMEVSGDRQELLYTSSALEIQYPPEVIKEGLPLSNDPACCVRAHR